MATLDGWAGTDRGVSRDTAAAATAAHRRTVVRRLLAEGMPVRALEALLPRWELEIAEALEESEA